MKKHAENSLLIAFATSNEQQVNEHFGRCNKLTIYRLSTSSSEHIKTVNFNPSEDHHPQKTDDKLAALSDCFAVYCLACGNPVRHKLLTQGTRVVMLPHAQLIDTILSQIQENWPGEIALRQEKLSNKKKDADYFNKLAQSEWE
ncbi:MAG: NifB/NifX family molybdenum-iron cluster-binding protein [Psychromonas sp.]